MIILIVILISAAALAAAEWKWGVLSAVYDAKKLPHRLLALLPMVAMLFTAPVFLKYFADARDDVEYPLKGSVANYNPYIQQFDAWEKGQLNIDFEVDSRILELENPYDYQARRLAGGYYLWDRAMYDGKYYSYFGIAPIVTVYYPYWLIKGALPGDSTVMAVFIFITALFCRSRFSSGRRSAVSAFRSCR